jgi:lipid-A-disaccharide synthase
VRLASQRSERALRALLESGVAAPKVLDVRVGPQASEPPLSAALTTSGTSTTELAVALVPMAVFYRVSWIGRIAARLLVTSPFVSMANLLAGRRVVSERLVGAGAAPVLAQDVLDLLSDPSRWGRTRADLAEIRAKVAHPDVADRVARAVLA